MSVLVKGTTTGTVTDDNGKFTLSVPDGNAVLVFSSVGFSTQEIAVGGKSTIDVILTEGEALQEVVVVGYCTQRKVDLTGAVSSISAKDMNGKPATSMDQLMSGRSSGVQISNRSGDPGAPIEVRIRGVGTVGVNQPLWVIDGVPVVLTSNASVNTGSSTESNPLAGINPSDIETMDILKDASATAIYGARAANAPYYQGFDATDPTGYNPSTNATHGDGAIGNNYLWQNDTRFNETRIKNRKVLGSLYGEFEPIAGLKYRLTGGADYIVTDGFFFQEAAKVNYGAGERNSLLVQERPIELTTNVTNTLTYQKKFGKSDLLLMAGYEETNFRYDKVRLQGGNLFNTKIRFASVASSVAGANEADIWALRGALGRLFYSSTNIL